VTTDPTPKPITVDEATAKRAAEMLRDFAKPFDPKDVRLKPQLVKNNRALAIHYADARAVMDRLDEVAGMGGWEDAYTVLPDGTVECRLSVWVGGRRVTKADVGSPSDQPDMGDRMKAAYSDAFKRAAVKFGIGRYLYRLPQQWMDYDPVKKQIIQPARQQQQPARAGGAAGDYARSLVAKLDAMKNRDAGVALWRAFDADVKAGRVPETDREAVDAAFRLFGDRYPALPPPQPAAK
jgi:hypothetical protein